jgi:hypothetical protein
MIISRLYFGIFALVFLLTTPNLLSAGPYSDEMAKCLVNSTSEDDKSMLVQWIFAAFSHHPDVKNLTNITGKQATDFNKAVAELLTNLMTDRCKKETKAAIKYEGKTTIETSFTVLGSVAGRGLMSHPNVTKYTTDLQKYLDTKKFEEIFGSQ